MAIEYSKTVIIGLIILVCILMFVIVVDVVPCDSIEAPSEAFTNVEDILDKIKINNNYNIMYSDILSSQDDNIKSMYNLMYDVKNRIKQLN